MGLLIELLQVIDMDVKDIAVCERLCKIVAGRLLYKAFVSYYYLVVGAEENIFFFTLPVGIVCAEYAIKHKAQVPAYILVFVVKLPLFIMPFLPVFLRQTEAGLIYPGEIFQGSTEDLVWVHRRKQIRTQI